MGDDGGDIDERVTAAQMTTPLRQLVASALSEHPGEFMLFAQYQQLPAPRPSFAAHKAAALREMSERYAGKQATLRTLPDPSLISIKSWQYGFTEADDSDAAARGFADGLYLRLQHHLGDYLDSRRWAAHLDALERPRRWLELGRDAEDEGWTIESNACFAAARWLDPSCEAEIAELTKQRGPELPARLLRQPDPSYPGQPFAQRHWQAWDMKNYGRLDLPTLSRWACDRNFSIRTRIYRSLGQRPHPASIQVLQEGTADPHPFARAQAVRSLGWCADPTFVEELAELAEHDIDAEVRRSAAKAVQRIHGFWRHYGEWSEIAASPLRALEVAHALIDEGLEGFAWDIVVNFGMEGETEFDALLDAIEDRAHEREEPEDWHHDPSRYGHWFAEARAIEATPAPAPDPEQARAAVREPGERGFEARRVLRCLGLRCMS